MRVKNFVLLVLLAALWGPSFLFIKIAVIEIAPITLATFRIALGAILLNIFVLIKGGRFLKSLKFWKDVTIAGFFAQGAPFILINWGEQYIDSALASILNGLTPIFTILLAGIAIKQETLTKPKVVGIVIGFVGLVILVSPSFTMHINSSVWGFLAVVLGAACYGIALIYSRIHLIDTPPLYAPAGQLLVTTIYLIPLAFFIDGPLTISNISMQTWIAVFILGSFGTAVAFVVYYRVLISASASYLSLVTYLMPVFGVILGVIFLEETLYWETILGGILILLGVMVVNKTINFRRIRVFKALSKP